MWKKENRKKRALEPGSLHGGAKKGGKEGEEDVQDDEGVEEDPKDTWRVFYQPQHAGCLSIEELKASADYALRIPSNENDPKRKYAICFGYLGSNYQGLQINPGAVTVESILEKAMFLAGGIEECNYENLQKIGWTRAARTDRGVHAVSQLCGMKLRLPPLQEKTFIENVNRFLPADIRAFDLRRVTKSFNAKISCSARRYQYMLPTYMFTPQNTLRDHFKASTNDVNSKLSEERLKSIRKSLVSFRLSSAQFEALQQTLTQFQGTRKYHNFTYQKNSSDASAQRYITSFSSSEVFIQGEEGVEWVVLSVVGQSFLLNQIRKMVALVIDVMRGAAPEDIFSFVFEADKVEVPMALGIGLYLGTPLYDSSHIVL